MKPGSRFGMSRHIDSTKVGIISGFGQIATWKGNLKDDHGNTNKLCVLPLEAALCISENALQREFAVGTTSRHVVAPPRH